MVAYVIGENESNFSSRIRFVLLDNCKQRGARARLKQMLHDVSSRPWLSLDWKQLEMQFISALI